MPLADVDEAGFKKLVRESMEKNGRHGPELVDEIESAIGDFFEISRKARKSGDVSMLEATSVATVLLSVSASLSELETDQDR